ncbi:hypothetical protein [Azospirillum sp. SYSU D00513]|uniref:hypothetical protein n=1 Tax=Azospirillum sp. SYSU D00513 TaxID=2812561 RepID=UPI001A97D30D|nr:hypothetical protein [Azospirillum sp. SYSU D00513]
MSDPALHSQPDLHARASRHLEASCARLRRRIDLIGSDRTAMLGKLKEAVAAGDDATVLRTMRVLEGAKAKLEELSFAYADYEDLRNELDRARRQDTENGRVPDLLYGRIVLFSERTKLL